MASKDNIVKKTIRRSFYSLLIGSLAYGLFLYVRACYFAVIDIITNGFIINGVEISNGDYYIKTADIFNPNILVLFPLFIICAIMIFTLLYYIIKWAWNIEK